MLIMAGTVAFGSPNRAQKGKIGYLLLKNQSLVQTTGRSLNLGLKEVQDEYTERIKSVESNGRDQIQHKIPTQTRAYYQMTICP